MMTRLFSARRKRHRAAALRARVHFIKDVVNEFLTDNCPQLAASISFYLLLSLFPLTLGVISVIGFFTASSETESRVIQAIGGFLPIPGDDITNYIEGVTSSPGTTSVIATIGLLWGGSSVFNAIRKSLNTAWGVRKTRNFLVERAIELGMMIGGGLLLMASFSMTTALSVFPENDITFAGISFFNVNVFSHALLILLTIGLAFVTFLFLYKFIPNAQVRWGDVWGGALLAAVGFEIIKQVFVWYATAHYAWVYGPIGAVIGLLVWTYASALILLFCAKLTSVYSKHKISFYEDIELRGKEETRISIRQIEPSPQLSPPLNFKTDFDNSSGIQQYKEDRR